MSNISGFVDPIGSVIVPVFMLFVVSVIAIWFLQISSSFEKFLKYKRFWRVLYKMFKLSAYGTLTIIVFGVPTILGYFAIQYAGEQDINWLEVGKWVGICISIFVSTVIVGYLTEKRWNKYFINRRRYKNEQISDEKRETQKTSS
jgi:ABC-type spermidine/putrescine transport system permease subunit I